MSAIVLASSTEVAATLLRCRCSECCMEVSYGAAEPNSRELFALLLQSSGWRLGANPLCPKCYKLKARQAFDSLRE